MASVKSFLEIPFLIIVLLMLDQQNTEGTRRDLSDLISHLTNKHHVHKQPLVIILDKDHGVHKKELTLLDMLGISPETSDDKKAEDLRLHHFLGDNKLKKKPVQYKKSTTKSSQSDNKKRQKFRSQKFQEDQRSLKKENRQVLRSPIVKKLLRISNSLRCEAKDECQDKCTNKFNGKNEKKCQVQCEIKYVCDEEEEDNESCDEDGCDDSCGGSKECNGMSTKGVKLVTEEPGCVRC